MLFNLREAAQETAVSVKSAACEAFVSSLKKDVRPV